MGIIPPTGTPLGSRRVRAGTWAYLAAAPYHHTVSHGIHGHIHGTDVVAAVQGIGPGFGVNQTTAAIAVVIHLLGVKGTVGNNHRELAGGRDGDMRSVGEGPRGVDLVGFAVVTRAVGGELIGHQSGAVVPEDHKPAIGKKRHVPNIESPVENVASKNGA